MSTPTSTFPPRVLDAFVARLQTAEARESTRDDWPAYYREAPATTLASRCRVEDFAIATGAALFAHFAPVLLSARHSLTLVTCFWAPRSASLATLNDVLRRLSAEARAGARPRIRVRICLSSLSLAQKLRHTRSLRGRAWPPATWAAQLGLPDADELDGLDLQVKSIFVRPFSVMHPKFVIVDDRTVLLPSCNVSWEDWCEGCVQLGGAAVVRQFVRFYDAFWASDAAADDTTEGDGDGDGDGDGIPCLFLPSPHHANPHFRPPGARPRAPPATPLNAFLLAALAQARRSVVITTPNLTSPPLLDDADGGALLAAVRAGVDVTVYTSARMMLLEQVATAGTVTEWCVWRLRRRYRQMQQQQQQRQHDVERTANPPLGALKVLYFAPSPRAAVVAHKLHFKSTVIDDEIVVLGSGNMDRASWYTSQELGLALASRDLAGRVQADFQRFLQTDAADGGTALQVRRVI